MTIPLAGRPQVYYPAGALNVDANIQTTSGTAYAVYFGLFKGPVLIKKVWACTAGSGNGSGTCTAEVGLFSSPLAPNKAAQTLTKIVAGAFGATDFQSALARYHNTSDFATTIPAGSHVWGVIRIAMATTQPKVLLVAGDAGRGYVQTLSGASALTGITSLSGMSIPALGAWTTGIAPALWLTEN